jgi:hypothetical protein
MSNPVAVCFEEETAAGMVAERFGSGRLQNVFVQPELRLCCTSRLSVTSASRAMSITAACKAYEAIYREIIEIDNIK